MKILVDLGHPAHLHYFKNVIKLLNLEGHEFIITARDKEVLHKLLESMKLIYIDRGKGYNHLIGKLLYIIKADLKILKITLKLKPDLFLGFASPYAAHIAWLLNKPSLTLDDTEHAKLSHKLYAPFTDVILSPDCFLKPFSKKQVFFKSYMELAYLHPKYFKPDEKVLGMLNIKKGEKFALIRFVSWNASHDIGQFGISNDDKILLVNELKKIVPVFISAEGSLPTELESNRIIIPPELLHDVLAFSALYIGEGATTASECAVMGVPAIYVNSLKVGYIEEQVKYNLAYSFRNFKGVLELAKDILKNEAVIIEYKKNRDKLLEDKIDLTSFLVWFISNYPSSKKIMMENPDYQNRFH